jgi:hypothetical protein
MTMAGWRKYSLAAAALFMSFILAILGKLTGDFATVAAVVVGSFNVAHAAQDWRNGHAAVPPKDQNPADSDAR